MVDALKGLKIIDLTLLFPGPFGMKVFADFGAEVIKIENRANPDATRGLPPLVGTSGRRRQSFFYHTLNRNKKSLTLNLKKQEALEIFYKLAKEADVIVEQFRPGVVKKLRVDYETIKKINPRIIYCSITGYGQDGPYRDFPGHDLNYTAYAGVAGLNQSRDEEPILPGLQIADMVGGGLNAVIGILLALYARQHTGKGQHIDISMMDGVLGLNQMFLAQWLAMRAKPKLKEQPLTGALPQYQMMKCKDGKYFSIGALEPKFYTALLRQIGREDLLKGSFSRAQVFEELNKTFLTKDRDTWTKEINDCEFNDAKMVAPVYEVDEVENDPQVQARNLIIDVETPHGTIKQIGFPIKLSETPATLKFCAPTVGQHNEEILGTLGYSPEEVKALRKKKVI
ncbi:MAG: CoA transferase [Candidatus Helarchaeota archaeon]|nr:CoA transferase [Candidatus Helarchaeota archaeon]